MALYYCPQHNWTILDLYYIYCSISKQKRNKFISGVPFFGGFILAVAFLFSPIKWLAFLGFIDYGLWFLPYSLIYDHFQNRRFQKVYMQQDFVQRVRDNTKSLSIKILERNEDLLNPFVTNLVYNLAVPKLLFAICTDKDGKNYLLVDKYEKTEISQYIHLLIIQFNLQDLN